MIRINLKPDVPSPALFSGRAKARQRARAEKATTALLLRADAPAHSDRLGRSALVKALAIVMATPRQKGPLTIGVLGPWGAGKSSLMSQVRGLLSKRAGRRFTFAHFDAWGNAHADNIAAALTQGVVKGILESRGQVGRSMLRLRFAARRYRTQLLLALAVTLLLAVGAIRAEEWVRINHDKWKVEALVGLISSLSVLLIGFLRAVERLVEHPLSVQLQTYLDLGTQRQHLGHLPVLREDLLTLCELHLGKSWSPKRQRRLVIQIDDLDRCRPSVVLEVIDAVRIVLDIPNVFVMLAASSTSLLAAVGSRAQSAQHAPEVEPPGAYLEKLIQLSVTLQRPHRDNLSDFVTDAFRPEEPNESPTGSRLRNALLWPLTTQRWKTAVGWLGDTLRPSPRGRFRAKEGAPGQDVLSRWSSSLGQVGAWFRAELTDLRGRLSRLTSRIAARVASLRTHPVPSTTEQDAPVDEVASIESEPSEPSPPTDEVHVDAVAGEPRDAVGTAQGAVVADATLDTETDAEGPPEEPEPEPEAKPGADEGEPSEEGGQPPNGESRMESPFEAATDVDFSELRDALAARRTTWSEDEQLRRDPHGLLAKAGVDLTDEPLVATRDVEQAPPNPFTDDMGHDDPFGPLEASSSDPFAEFDVDVDDAFGEGMFFVDVPDAELHFDDPFGEELFAAEPEQLEEGLAADESELDEDEHIGVVGRARTVVNGVRANLAEVFDSLGSVEREDLEPFDAEYRDYWYEQRDFRELCAQYQIENPRRVLRLLNTFRLLMLHAELELEGGSLSRARRDGLMQMLFWRYHYWRAGPAGRERMDALVKPGAKFVEAPSEYSGWLPGRQAHATVNLMDVLSAGQADVELPPPRSPVAARAAEEREKQARAAREYRYESLTTAVDRFLLGDVGVMQPTLPEKE